MFMYSLRTQYHIILESLSMNCELYIKQLQHR